MESRKPSWEQRFEEFKSSRPTVTELFLTSQQFFALTHTEVQEFLRSHPSDVDEYCLFKGIIAWAKRSIENANPDVDEMKKVIAPTDANDLMSQIRIPRLTREQWFELCETEEIALLPLTLLDKTRLDKYFASASSEDQEQMLKRPEMLKFNFWQHKIKSENSNSSIRTESEKSNFASRRNEADQRISEEPRSKKSNSESGRNESDEHILHATLSSPPLESVSRLKRKRTLASSPEKNDNETPAYTPYLGDNTARILPREKSTIKSNVTAAGSLSNDVTLENSEERQENRSAATSERSLSDNHKRSKRCSLPTPTPRVLSYCEEIPSDPLPSTSTSSQNRRNKVSITKITKSAASKSKSISPALSLREVTSHAGHADQTLSIESQQWSTSLMPFSEYIQSLSRQTEIIRTEFVVDDHIKGLNLDKLPRQVFPNLKEFHLKFKFSQADPEHNNLPKRFKEFLCQTMDLKKYLCFVPIGGIDSITLSTLWNCNVNFSLEFHGCMIIKMDHQNQEFILNTPKNALAILRGVAHVPLRKLALGCCLFNDQYNFEKVEELTLYGVKGTTTFNDVLEKCPSLTELTLWKNERPLEPVDLSSIRNPKKLKCLALCRTEITIPNSKPVFSNLKTLHLNNSICYLGFDTAFPKMFPKIKKISISLRDAKGSGISLQFIVSILQIITLEWGRFANVNWDHQNSKSHARKKFKEMTGLNDKNCTAFILSKCYSSSPLWKADRLNDKEDPNTDVPGGYWDMMDEQEVEFFKLGSFYNRFSDTVPAWLTYSNFAISCI